MRKLFFVFRVSAFLSFIFLLGTKRSPLRKKAMKKLGVFRLD